MALTEGLLDVNLNYSPGNKESSAYWLALGALEKNKTAATVQEQTVRHRPTVSHGNWAAANIILGKLHFNTTFKHFILFLIQISMKTKPFSTMIYFTNLSQKNIFFFLIL